MNKKDKVEKILIELSLIDKSKIPTIGDNRIDIDKVENVKEIKDALEKLRKLEVNGEWLFNNGFVAAGLFIGRIL
jgi:hypothetical protein